MSSSDRSPFVPALPLVMLALGSLPAHGQTTTYLGPDAGDWFASEHWTEGTPTASTHAVVDIARTVAIAAGAASTSSLTLDHGGGVALSGPSASLIAESPAKIGVSDHGTLSLTGGSTATLASLRTGIDATGSGTVVIDGPGSKLTTLNTDHLGDLGASSITIRNGGHYDAQGAEFFMGERNTGSLSTITVTGTGSTLSSAGYWFAVGYTGRAAVTVSDGATVSSGRLTIALDTDGTPGGVQGSVTVTGSGSRWDIDGQLTIGSHSYFDDQDYSIGTMTIADGATVQVGGSSVIEVDRRSTLLMGNGGASGTLVAGVIRTRGNVIFDHSDDVSFSVPIEDHGIVPNLGSLTKTGSGTLTLAVANTGFTGTTTITGGTLAIAANNRLGSNPSTPTPNAITLDGGTLRATASFTLNANRGIALGAAGGTLAVDADQRFVYGGVIAGAGRLTKTGTGMLVLTGTNTYTGPTDILAGKLLVNGSGTASASAFTVHSGGTVGGVGTIGALTVAGTLAPGVDANRGAFHAADTDFLGGGIYQWDILRATGTPGNQWDLLSVTGGLDIGSTPANPFTLAITSINASGVPAPAANFDPAQSYTWILVSTTSGITGFDADAFSIDASGFANAPDASRFSLSTDGNNLVLTYSAVPEPAAWGILGALSLLAIALRGRRSR